MKVTRITRVYADEQGESHFEDREVELRDAGAIGHLSEPVPAKAVLFRKNDPGYDYDWHVAPQRQFIVLLDGAIEIEVSSGERRTFRGGEVLLLEDTTGKGHRTRHVEPSERQSIFIVLE
uniref:Cupin 2 conserved barrel domain-containing protein n=1 Tax=uncultured Armatimonadetes bacterium TaxID=157466 RepID=A0A6J4JMV2_9BACT|nr:hypothetical protein AVDCRST_MAG63-4060 [uncultured Armatimonadetes bacterium]